MKPDLDSELEGLRIDRTLQPHPRKRPRTRLIILSVIVAIGAAAVITAYELHDSAPLVEVTRVMAAQNPSRRETTRWFSMPLVISSRTTKSR